MAYQPKKFVLPADGVLKKSGAHNPYVFNDRIAVAVDVALATNRPLLVSGVPGCGKSALAPAMARVLGYRYLATTLTSRTRLGDLTSEVDQLRRLHDAQLGRGNLPPAWTYEEPGLLWWALNPASARLRGQSETAVANQERDGKAPDGTRTASLYVPPVEPPTRGDGPDVVLLLDEIDKAEPDLPNDLLEPLDVCRFNRPQGGGTVSAPKGFSWLVIITTNGERELPPAFVRRCITLELEEPGADELVDIGKKHFARVRVALLRAVADKVVSLRDEAAKSGRRAPATSEFLDAVRACADLGVTPESAVWAEVERVTLQKDNL
ncbi:MAG: MoxR family ATPase [Pseudomonadota bacterium]